MNKKGLSERDICTKFITPALRRAGGGEQTQLREEVTFTTGEAHVEYKAQLMSSSVLPGSASALAQGVAGSSLTKSCAGIPNQRSAS